MVGDWARCRAVAHHEDAARQALERLGGLGVGVGERTLLRLGRFNGESLFDQVASECGIEIVVKAGAELAECDTIYHAAHRA